MTRGDRNHPSFERSLYDGCLFGRAQSRYHAICSIDKKAWVQFCCDLNKSV